MSAACSTCKFSDIGIDEDGLPTLMCRRFPPTPDGGRHWWAGVEENDWCGEWAEKP